LGKLDLLLYKLPGRLLLGVVMFSVYFATSLLFSCSHLNDKPSEESVCSTEISSTVPYPNSQDMYYRGVIEAFLTEEDTQAAISLYDDDGNTVLGATTLQSNVLSFTPNEPLIPSHNYVAVIEYCGSIEPVELPFTTSSLGTPLQGGNEILRDKTFSVDLSSGVMFSPDKVGEVLRGLLQNTFLISVSDIIGDEVQIRLALSEAESIEQNFCVPTIEDFPYIDISEAPYFSLRKSNIPINIANYDFTLYSLEASGTIFSDGSSFDQIIAQGTLDLREIYPIFQDIGITSNSVDEFCAVLDGLGSECEICDLDSEPYCLSIGVKELYAGILGNDLYPVCEANCHEFCPENSDTCTEQQITDECH
jgi:hypothetical protein